MKNIPRIFLCDNIMTGMSISAPHDVVHYLTRVMRRHDFLAFGGGTEYNAMLSDDNKTIMIGETTSHPDPSNNITVLFSPIKKTDDLLNMATQMGVSGFQPVITERTVANNINWARMEKIVTESAEQSNRNSVPKILPIKKFDEIDLSHIAFADERAAYGAELPGDARGTTQILIGPEGGFSDREFAALDASGAIGIGLGKTILRAELAAAIAVSRMLQ